MRLARKSGENVVGGVDFALVAKGFESLTMPTSKGTMTTQSIRSAWSHPREDLGVRGMRVDESVDVLQQRHFADRDWR